MKPTTSFAASKDLIPSGRLFYLTLDYIRALRAGAVEAAAETWAARGAVKSVGDVAVIPVMGMITQRGSWYGMSIDGVRAALRAALADSSIGSIVLEFDSPGGEVYGVEEFATEIRAARTVKPIVGVANALSASASYYLMAQCGFVMVTPSGEAGSIGVWMMHMDWSGALDQMGIVATIISAGEGKTLGNSYEALTPEDKKLLEGDVQRYFGMFVNSVSKGRAVAVDVIRNDWKALVYGAKEAVKIGMADAVGTIEDAIKKAASLARERQAVGAARSADAESRQRMRERALV